MSRPTVSCSFRMKVVLALLVFGWVAAAANAEDAADCRMDGKSFKIKERYEEPGKCGVLTCLEDGWSHMSCGVSLVPPKWELVHEDPSKPYPECCGRAVPPLDIVPDVLTKLVFSEAVDVTYEGDVKVDMGNDLTPTQVKNMPKITYKANADSFYLIAMVAPDVPSRKDPKDREFLLYLAGNIPGSDVAAGDTIADYIGAAPRKDTGLHRFVFLVYKQPGRLNFDEPRVNSTTADHRGNFHIQKLAEKYSLGDPVAINVFQAQYDDYVPQLHQQLGLNA